MNRSLVLSFLFFAGCKGPEEKALALLEAQAAAVCACKDAACVEKAVAASRGEGDALKKEMGDKKPSEAFNKKATALVMKSLECSSKLKDTGATPASAANAVAPTP